MKVHELFLVEDEAIDSAVIAELDKMFSDDSDMEQTHAQFLFASKDDTLDLHALHADPASLKPKPKNRVVLPEWAKNFIAHCKQHFPHKLASVRSTVDMHPDSQDKWDALITSSKSLARGKTPRGEYEMYVARDGLKFCIIEAEDHYTFDYMYASPDDVDALIEELGSEGDEELWQGSMNEALQQFSVEHQNGRHKRKHTMSMSKIIDSIMFTPAEKRKISKLDVGGTFTTQSSTVTGRTIIRVTRES